MKTRQENDVTDRIDLIYVKTEIELSIPIWTSVIYAENQKGQWYDPSCRCDLRWKQNWVVVTNRIGCHLLQKPRITTWLIVQVQSKLNTILNYHDWSNQVPTMIKTIQDNYMTDSKDAVYAKN